MYETKEEYIARKEAIAIARREQEDAVSSALVKIDMMGLTFPECMIECPVPKGIHPMRWKAMIHSALQIGKVPE